METNVTTVASLPDKLVLGGVSYNVGENPELDAFRSAVIKHAAHTEKTKLYSQMNELKSKILALQNVKVEASPSPTPVDTDKLKKEVVSELSSVIKDQLSAALSPLQRSNEEAQKREINEYRNQLLVANQGKCMPELVVGDTKEKLDEALQTSIKLFAQYGKIETPLGPNGALQTSTTQAPVTSTNNTTNPIVVPPANNNPAVVIPPAKIIPPSNDALNNVKSMKADDYAKERERLLKEAEKLIGS